MMKMNLQFFAHKKGMGSTKNGRDSESKRLGAQNQRDLALREQTDSLLRLETFSIDSVEQRFTQA